MARVTTSALSPKSVTSTPFTNPISAESSNTSAMALTRSSSVPPETLSYDDPDHRHHRWDRQIDAARHDHERLPECRDGQHRRERGDGGERALAERGRADQQRDTISTADATQIAANRFRERRRTDGRTIDTCSYAKVGQFIVAVIGSERPCEALVVVGRDAPHAFDVGAHASP